MKRYFIVMAVVCLLSTFLDGQNYKDCIDPFPICALKTYHFDDLSGTGSMKDVHSTENCDQSVVETNSIWLEFEAQSDGIVTFAISPEQEEDDIDFVVYQKHQDCQSLKEVRCMQSGISYGDNQKDSGSCQGETGLNNMSMDEFELSGCNYNDDNFLKFLLAKEGETFIIYINNYDSPKGLSISFEGTVTLENLEGCLSSTKEPSFEMVGLFPNPTSEEISIQYNSLADGLCTVEVLSIDGKILKTFQKVNSTGSQLYSIDVKDLSNATYLIRVSQSGLSSIKQFIKQ